MNDLTGVAIGGLLVILLVFGIWRWRSRTVTAPPNERYGRTLRFHGSGEMTVRAPGLIASQYRMDYEMPDDVLVKVDLLDSVTGDRELILVKCGTGVAGFDVPHAGDYLLHIAPASDSAAWRFEIRPVGLGRDTNEL